MPVIRPEPKARVQRGSERSGESREKSVIKGEAQFSKFIKEGELVSYLKVKTESKDL
jgi:hypothetical protein